VPRAQAATGPLTGVVEAAQRTHGAEVRRGHNLLSAELSRRRARPTKRADLAVRSLEVQQRDNILLQQPARLRSASAPSCAAPCPPARSLLEKLFFFNQAARHGLGRLRDRRSARLGSLGGLLIDDAGGALRARAHRRLGSAAHARAGGLTVRRRSSHESKNGRQPSSDESKKTIPQRLTVAGEAAARSCTSNSSETCSDSATRSPLTSVSTRLSSSSEFMDSTHCVSTGPSSTSHLCAAERLSQARRSSAEKVPSCHSRFLSKLP
jgi:hypothetical protein